MQLKKQARTILTKFQQFQALKTETMNQRAKTTFLDPGRTLSTIMHQMPQWLKNKAAAIKALIFFISLLFIAASISSSWNIDTSKFSAEISANKTILISSEKPIKLHEKRIEFPLNCTINNQTQTCPTNYPITVISPTQDPNLVCPNYFRWIHDDLQPWKDTGITRDMVEKAKKTAHFRLIIIKGKAYVEKYRKSIQTRDVFTLWGILQLLRRYPGRLPDLELMFDCDDRPVVRSEDYVGGSSTGPPPLFRYCGDRWTRDIVFPDWSFWGWAEINIKPWEELLREIKEGNEKSKWIDREAYAYWKGNPFVAETRKDLLTCNVSHQQDWNARLFIQDWVDESKQGFKHSDLSTQCTHRYKIYIEGYAWSVSEKYILACNSMTLLVKPHYHDFFTRSLQPLQHYWPIQDTDKCRSIKFAVDWGNNNTEKAEEIGEAVSKFMQEEMKMENVYDYMFHLLNGYAMLLKFKPQIPEGAKEICSEIMACPSHGLEKKFMTESLVKSPSLASPCTIPPPFPPHELAEFYRQKLNAIRKVQKWEVDYYHHHH